MHLTISNTGNFAVLSTKECWSCNGTLRVNGWATCPDCNGTGKKDPARPKGRNCPRCNRNGSYTKGRIVVLNSEDCSCTRNATPGFMEENICDTVPREWIDALPVIVYRSNRPQGIAESLFGSGLYSCTDYGRWQKRSDDELIADVRSSATHVQAINIVRKSDMKLCSHIGVFCNDNGYSVMGVWESAAEIESRLKRQLPEAVGMQVGMKLYGMGLPGSLMVKDYLRPE